METYNQKCLPMPPDVQTLPEFFSEFMDSATMEVVCAMDVKLQVEVIALSMFRSNIQQEIKMLAQQGEKDRDALARQILTDFVQAEKIASELLTGILLALITLPAETQARKSEARWPEPAFALERCAYFVSVFIFLIPL